MLLRIAFVCLCQILLALSLPVGHENANVPLIPPRAGPGRPIIEGRTETSIKLRWLPPPGPKATLYNLVMNKVSLYSGPNNVFEATSLIPGKCYAFQVTDCVLSPFFLHAPYFILGRGLH
jgi:hypothetical protein